MNYKNSIHPDVIKLLEENNGRILNGDYLLTETQINWDHKGNQTRQSDQDMGHIAALCYDIKARGLMHKPILELGESGLFNPVSGHHRLAALSRLLAQKQIEQIPCAIVEFASNIDRELFMQGENHHPPTKAHTRSDATRFIQSMKSHGYFPPELSGEETKKMVDKLLEKQYCRLNAHSREHVYHEAFAEKETKRIVRHTNEQVVSKAKSHHGKQKPFTWANGTYLCWGDTNSARKAIAVALEKRVHALDKGDAKISGNRGKVSVTTHFKTCKNENELASERTKFLKTEQLLNKHAYGPGKVIIIDQVCFLAQIDGKRGTKETKMIIHKWNYEQEKFIKL